MESLMSWGDKLCNFGIAVMEEIKAATICGKVFFAADIACMCIVALMVLYVLIFGNI